jgi:hypothetical protein
MPGGQFWVGVVAQGRNFGQNRDVYFVFFDSGYVPLHIIDIDLGVRQQPKSA